MRILDLFDLETTIVDSSKISLDESRIDPQFFSSNQLFIDNLDTKPLSHFCEEIFNPGVFKREFLEDSNECRYLASAEIASFEPEITYITNSQADALRLRVKKGWVLITGFGTIGSIRITDSIIDGYAVANNVTRAIVKEKYSGFIAAFLASEYGNKLLNDYAAGAVVKYIEAPQISKIPVPVINESIISSIDKKYLTAVTCREQSHELLQRANALVLQYNNLPPITDIKPETLDSDRMVEIRMTNLNEFTQDYRLDAHFYNPIAKVIVENIIQHCPKNDNLYNIADCSFRGSRSTRNYVDKDNGIAFLSGKNIIQIRPDFKYISKSETANLDDMLLSEGQILISRSGTLGRTLLIYKNYEGCTASEHLIRVKPETSKIDSGYLYAFLSSDYGFHQLLRYKHGAVIDEITEDQISQSLIPLPLEKQQKEIGDLVRQAYELRAEAIRLEDEAQELLTQALTQV
ncbi:restriction endonuclease subunit S [Parasediminibacterium paludis]|uniref:Restriction endonuclease subunit S n=1 Tax=Parasediminibacterium paludis TaxID=908966 RepID=A0ABV8PTN6_9BACT